MEWKSEIKLIVACMVHSIFCLLFYSAFYLVKLVWYGVGVGKWGAGARFGECVARTYD
jgi:hypothetical protein